MYYYSSTQKLLRALLDGSSIKAIDSLLQETNIQLDFYGTAFPYFNRKYSLLTAALEHLYGKRHRRVKSAEWEDFVVKRLLEKGANPKADPETLHLAVKEGIIPDQLLSHYPTLTNTYYRIQQEGKSVDIPLFTYFCLYSSRFSKESALRLIQKDPNILKEETSTGEKPLDFILRVWNKNFKKTETRNLSAILDLFSQEEVNASASAHEKAQNGKFVLDLIKHGLDVHSIKDQNGNGLMFLTLKNIYENVPYEDGYEVFHHLKRTNIDLNAQNNQGETPLTALLKLESIYRGTQSKGYTKTPLHEAHFFIKETDVDVSMPNKKGETPLICLAKQSYLAKLSKEQTLFAAKLMTLMIEKGADPFKKDATGNSAICYIENNKRMPSHTKAVLLNYLYTLGKPATQEECDLARQTIVETFQKMDAFQKMQPTCVAHAQTPAQTSSVNTLERGTQD